MNILIAADSLLSKTPDGKYWCKTIYDYQFWQRYLNVYDEITIISRCQLIKQYESESLLRVDGPRINVIELPYMRKMKGYLLNLKSFKKIAKQASENFDYAIFRMPSVSATMIWEYFKKTNKPYLIEIVADPYEAYKENFLAKHIYTSKLKEAALNANGVSYVTKYYLQNKYPSKISQFPDADGYHQSYYSTINLMPEFLAKPKLYPKKIHKFKMLHISNQVVDLKGYKEAIEVAYKLKRLGLNVELTFVGDGGMRSKYEKIINNYNLDDSVRFAGLISDKETLRQTLIAADLFLFPSKAEGLPRVVIEAMACGLPVISTNISGIPELINEEFLFDPDDTEGMTDKILELIKSPEKLNRISQENLENSREYLYDVLSVKRNDFYKKLIKYK